ncbi:MAG TPA: hypothetical protein VNJ50_10300 [Gelidibacter sp.]|uniref:hypothetical protein n=1 Tax=Gelidibacter sp. TaxID=2018083 RepID=UPI002C7D94A5|nr:hypothetical protein [Gelidibacter sp.]HXJ99229.1 hypothetical protein [Gelidibacter sp.]
MNQNKQYKFDLWLFMACTMVLLYLLLINLMISKNWSNDVFNSLMDWMSVPIYSLGIILPIVVVIRLVLNKTQNRSLAVLSLLFSLLSFVFIGYSTFV